MQAEIDFIKGIRTRLEAGQDVNLSFKSEDWLYKKAVRAGFGTYCCEVLEGLEELYKAPKRTLILKDLEAGTLQ